MDMTCFQFPSKDMRFGIGPIAISYGCGTIKRNLSKSAFSAKRWIHLSANLR